MRTVVVGVDGSEPSLRALRFAAILVADLSDAELVVGYARYLPYLWAPEHVVEDEFGDLLDEQDKYVGEKVERELDRAGVVRWRIERREGEPSQVLRDMAREADASFLVVGRRGWSVVEELLLGSVSNRLVHRAEVPVLLVR